MGRRFRRSLLALCLTAVAGCSAQTVLPAAMNTEQVTYQVFGMDCPGCHGGLEKNIEKIPGVVDASANWKEQTVTIRFDAEQDLDLARVEKAIRDSNFTPGERLR